MQTFSLKLSEALKIAVEAHNGQPRKGTDIPYICHPLGVSSIVVGAGGNEVQACAALLHDAVEDGGAEYAEIIKDRMGDDVLRIVQACTDGVPDSNGVKASWKERKIHHLASTEDPAHTPDEALIVLAADKLYNLRAIYADAKRIGDEVYSRFKAGKEGTLWYYDSMIEVLEKRGAPLCAEIKQTLAEVKQLTACP